MKKLIALICVLALAGTFVFAGGGSDDSGKAKKMVVGFGVPDGHFEQRALVEFKNYIETNTNGAIEVELHGSNSIGVDLEVLEQIKINVAQMNLPSPAVLANIIPEANLLAIPFLFSSQEMALDIVNGPWGKQLEPYFEKAGYVSLGFAPFGFRHLSSAQRPLDSMEALKGFKLRTLQNNMHVEIFSALGANPTPMPFSEMFTALQQGVIDGQENPLGNIYSQKLHEALTSITLNGHVFDWLAIVVGKDFYDGLTAEQQKIINEAADIAIQYMADALIEDDEKARIAMEADGIIFIEPSQEFLNDMREGAAVVSDRFGNEINSELYNSLKKEIADYK